MKTKTPYNAGEIRKNGNLTYLICGHIWWPVEQVNAYHCIKMVNGEPSGPAEYIWDHSHGNWTLMGNFGAEAQAA